MQIFRLSIARMKILKISYAIFQATIRFSFKFCITLQCDDTYFLWSFLAETLYALDKMIPLKYNFSDFECSSLMKNQLIPHVVFKPTRSGFIQILNHFLVSWNITSWYFHSSNLVYFGQKEAIENKFSDF